MGEGGGGLSWLSGKASASRAIDLGSIYALTVDLFSGRVTPMTLTLTFRWLPCQAFDVQGSTLGQDDPVSVNTDY